MTITMARGDVGAFSRRLEDLKETGSTLLLLSEDAGARSAVSAQLLGDQDADRRPVFVLLGRDRSVVEDRLPAGTTVEERRVVEYDFTRSAARSRDDPGPLTSRRLDDLDALLDEVREAVEAASAAADGPLASGELRVCLDSLAPVVDGFDRSVVEPFVDGLRRTMATHQGMAHAVLPLDSLSRGYEWLGPAFDGVVEARRVDGDVQERWQLPADGLATEWFTAAEVRVW